MNASYIASLFFTSLTISTTLYTSQERSVVQALPAWAVPHQTLKSDYKVYLQNRLEEYKKTDIDIETINMDELVSMSTLITGGNACVHKLFTRSDSEYNCFIHIAIEK